MLPRATKRVVLKQLWDLFAETFSLLPQSLPKIHHVLVYSNGEDWDPETYDVQDEPRGNIWVVKTRDEMSCPKTEDIDELGFSHIASRRCDFRVQQLHALAYSQ